MSRFRQELKKEIDELKNKINNSLSNSLNDSLTFVKMRSPVDTGLYRASWFSSKNKPSNKKIKKIKKPKNHTKGSDLYNDIPQNVKVSIDNDKKLYITNTVGYASYVNDRTNDLESTKRFFDYILDKRLKRIK